MGLIGLDVRLELVLVSIAQILGGYFLGLNVLKFKNRRKFTYKLYNRTMLKLRHSKSPSNNSKRRMNGKKMHFNLLFSFFHIFYMLLYTFHILQTLTTTQWVDFKIFFFINRKVFTIIFSVFFIFFHKSFS